MVASWYGNECGNGTYISGLASVEGSLCPTLAEPIRRTSYAPVTAHTNKMHFSRQTQFFLALVALLLVLPATQARPQCSDEVEDGT